MTFHNSNTQTHIRSGSLFRAQPCTSACLSLSHIHMHACMHATAKSVMRKSNVLWVNMYYEWMYYEWICIMSECIMSEYVLWVNVLWVNMYYGWIPDRARKRVMYYEWICIMSECIMSEYVRSAASHVSMHHVARVNESWQWVMSHAWMSHAIYMTHVIHTYQRVMAHEWMSHTDMGWLWLVGSFKIYVSFPEYSLFYRALLQKRHMFIGSLQIVATW